MTFLLQKIFVHGLNYWGYEVKKRSPNDEKSEGFPYYLEEAKQQGMDVNEYEEKFLGWPQTKPILEEILFPYLKKDAIVCELGPGTGRWSRHIAEKCQEGKLYLVDHSPWMVNFLRDYFEGNSNVSACLNDGFSLPFVESEWMDAVFCGGCFIAFKLSAFLCYAREFFRVLKPGGYCAFNYFDVETSEGWEHLQKHAADHGGNCYDYHAKTVVERVFLGAGFELVESKKIGCHTYLVVRKPEKDA